jgi:serine/threonine protein kinase
MAALNTPIEFETAFRTYTATEIIGEGGAGKVYAATDPDGARVAIKVLDKATTDKRKRFKNETAFLYGQRHANLVSVLDYGLISAKTAKGPFYVMERFDGSLRNLMTAGVKPESALELFAQVLNGVEAAHLLGVIHRDLKPENVLWQKSPSRLAIADFGIARFTADQLVTEIETAHGSRMANFAYAAPEQRVTGATVSTTADIFALGLMLNELFTKQVPHGTGYSRVADAHPDFSFVDAVVEAMIQQDARARPKSIEDVKHRMRLGRDQLMMAQKLAANQADVIPAGQVDHPLVVAPPQIVDVDWSNGRLRIILDKAVTGDWVQALYRMGNFTSLMGAEPQRFQFQGREASVQADEYNAQQVIDYFKQWIPKASARLKLDIEEADSQRRHDEQQKLKQERDALEARQRVTAKLRI